MTFGALLVEAGHGEAAARLHDFVAVRVVALNAIHAAFDDRMTLRKVELRMDIEVALETSGGIFAGINDEASASTADIDVFAGGAVAGFAAGNVREFYVIFVQLAVGARGKDTRNIGVARNAGGVADVVGAVDLRRGNDGAADTGTGDEKSEGKRKRSQNEERSFHGGQAVNPARHPCE